MDELAAKESLAQGFALAEVGKHEEAMEYFQKAEKENPMELDVYIAQGICFANMEKYDKSKEQFEKALKINRASGLTYFQLGNIAMVQGDVALGFEHYNKAISNGFEDAQLYYSIGLLHEEAGDFDLALRNYNKAISQDAKRPDIRIRKVYTLLANDRAQEAMQALDETILASPDAAEPYHLKFMVYLEQKQFAKAEAVLKEAAELFPDEIEFTMDKSTLLLEQGKFDEAKAVLAEIENADGIDNELLRRVHMNRAQITADDDMNATVSELEKAQQLAEQAGEFDSEIAFLLLNSYMSLENYEKVLEYARLTLEKTDDDEHRDAARYFEPLALKMLDRAEEARPLYEEAIDEYRNNALSSLGDVDSYLFRAMCHRDIGQLDKALELVEYVVKLDSERGDAILLRGAIYEELGQSDKAAADIKTAERIFARMA